MRLRFLFYGYSHTKHSQRGQPNGTEEPIVCADSQLADHEWMHGSTGKIAPKAKGAWLVSNESQGCGLTWVGFDGDIVAIQIKSMHNIIADELEGYGIARVDFKLGGGIGKLSRINLKGPRLRRNGWNW